MYCLERILVYCLECVQVYLAAQSILLSTSWSTSTPRAKEKREGDERARVSESDALQHTATHCDTLQHTAIHCNTLQHTATHCHTNERQKATKIWVSEALPIERGEQDVERACARAHAGAHIDVRWLCIRQWKRVGICMYQNTFYEYFHENASSGAEIAHICAYITFARPRARARGNKSASAGENLMCFHRVSAP